MNETNPPIDETNPPKNENPPGWEWAFVEIFGHRTHAGLTREVERFGVKMLRVDVPIIGGAPDQWETHFYTGAAIFSFRLSTEAAVRKANEPYTPPARITYDPPTATTYHDHDDTQPGRYCFDDEHGESEDDEEDEYDTPVDAPDFDQWKHRET